jgi:non-ribosomal peptide synthetase component F
MFVLENAPLPELRLSDLVVAPVMVDSASAKFPLALLAYEAGETITCLFEYNTALFNEETISLMAEGYEMVLEQVTKQPAVRLSAIAEALRKRQETHLQQEESRYDEIVRGKLKKLTRQIAG